MLWSAAAHQTLERTPNKIKINGNGGRCKRPGSFQNTAADVMFSRTEVYDYIGYYVEARREDVLAVSVSRFLFIEMVIGSGEYNKKR